MHGCFQKLDGTGEPYFTTRDELLTASDVRNLAEKLDKSCAMVRGSDVEELECLLQSLRDKLHDPVLLYKPQSVTEVQAQGELPGQLKLNLSRKDRFVLVLQTKSQHQLYEDFGAGSVITFDATHHTTGIEELVCLC